MYSEPMGDNVDDYPGKLAKKDKENSQERRNKFIFEDREYSRKDINNMSYYDLKSLIERVKTEMERHSNVLRKDRGDKNREPIWSTYLSFLIKFKSELKSELNSRMPMFEQAFIEAAKSLLDPEDFDEIVRLAEINMDKIERLRNQEEIEKELEERVLGKGTI
jgi:hypothetical protein